MPNKLAGIIGCLIVAALVNVSPRTWIPSFDLSDLLDGKVEFDGSTMVCSQVYATSELNGHLVEGVESSNNSLSQITAAYNDSLKSGGKSWLGW